MHTIVIEYCSHLDTIKKKGDVKLKKILVSDLKLIQNQLNEPDKYPAYIQETMNFKLKHLRDDILQYEEEYMLGHLEAINLEYQKIRTLAKQKLNIDMEALFEK